MQGPGSTPEWKVNLRTILRRTEDNLESRRIFLNQSSSPKEASKPTLPSAHTLSSFPSAYDIPYSKSTLISSRVDDWKSQEIQDDVEVENLKEQISELKKQNEELNVQLTQLSAKVNSRSDSYEDDWYSKPSTWKREAALDKEALLDSVKKEVEIVIQASQLEHQKEILKVLYQQMQQVLQPLHQQMEQHLSQMDKMEAHHDKLREQIQSTNQPLLQAVQQQGSLSQSIKFCESEVKEHKKYLENSFNQIQKVQQELHSKFSSIENQQLEFRHQLQRTQETVEKQSSLKHSVEDLERCLEEVKFNQSHQVLQKEIGNLKEDQEKSKQSFQNLVDDTKKSLSAMWQQDKEWVQQQIQVSFEALKNDVNFLRTQQHQILPLLQNSISKPAHQQNTEFPEISELKSTIAALQLQTTQLDWKLKEISNSSKKETDNLREQITQYIQYLQKISTDMLLQREELQKANQQEFSSIRKELLDNKLQLGILKKDAESSSQCTALLEEENGRLNSEIVALRMEQNLLQQEIRLRLDSVQNLVNLHEASLQRLSTNVTSLQAASQMVPRPSPRPSEIPLYISNVETPRVVDKTDLDERMTNLFSLQQDLFNTEKAIRDKLVTRVVSKAPHNPEPMSKFSTEKESVPKIIIEPPMSPQGSSSAPDTAKVKRKIEFAPLDLSKLEQSLQEQQIKEESGTFTPQEAEEVEEEEFSDEFSEEEEEVDKSKEEEQQEEEESFLDVSLHFSDEDENQLPIDQHDLPAASPRISLNDLLAMNS